VGTRATPYRPPGVEVVWKSGARRLSSTEGILRARRLSDSALGGSASFRPCPACPLSLYPNIPACLVQRDPNRGHVTWQSTAPSLHPPRAQTSGEILCGLTYFTLGDEERQVNGQTERRPERLTEHRVCDSVRKVNDAPDRRRWNEPPDRPAVVGVATGPATPAHIVRRLRAFALLSFGAVGMALDVGRELILYLEAVAVLVGGGGGGGGLREEQRGVRGCG